MSYHSKIIPSQATEHSSSKEAPPVVWHSLWSKVFLKTWPPPETPKVYAGQLQTPTAAFSCPGPTVAAWHHVSARSTVWAAQLQRRIKVIVFPSACLDAQPWLYEPRVGVHFDRLSTLDVSSVKCIIAVASVPIIEYCLALSGPSVDVEGDWLARGQMKAREGLSPKPASY